MAKPSYYEQLKDPRWQERRLRIMDRDGFECMKCGDTKKTLNVHHHYYERGADPWDYPDHALSTFCEDCHREQEAMLLEIRKLLYCPNHQRTQIPVAQVIGYIRGRMCEDGEKITARSWQEAVGIADAFGVSRDEYGCHKFGDLPPEMLPKPVESIGSESA